ncbi:MAG: class I SAM-dependent methyltransferase [Candidatus Fermentibacteraceae bacterium]|nr:class I SAM-dependent methyltransferase [Candidatus Fermentibacteraceae bacterium]MBN2609510.1 class I SAM-dependent methyltransferase [Candidatus Fermentibacteraceae bacterium]
MDLLEARLRDLRAPMVLDVATGGGGFSAHLRSEYGGLGTIVAVDVSEDGLGRARSNLKRIADLLPVCMDSACMAFQEGCFSLVCISNSLHHLDGLEETLEEMIRVLRPGGRFLVREMYRDGQTETQMTHVMMHEWWAAIDRRNGISHNRTFRRQEILNIVGNLDLEDVITGDYSSLESDPLEQELVRQLDSAIDSYLHKLEKTGGDPELRRRGDELRKRLTTRGFHSASSLSVMGRKPVPPKP